MKSDAIIFGSPIYVGDVTSLLRAFLERFFFMNISYDNQSHTYFSGKISGAFIYTMNVQPEMAEMYNYIYKMNDQLMQLLNGKTEYLISGDTYQFTDYAKYEASNFDEAHKAKVRDEQFPIDLKNAFELGKRLVTE